MILFLNFHFQWLQSTPFQQLWTNGLQSQFQNSIFIRPDGTQGMFIPQAQTIQAQAQTAQSQPNQQQQAQSQQPQAQIQTTTQQPAQAQQQAQQSQQNTVQQTIVSID